jgi:3-methylcrotonyl-CoA carboxylase alpha subunit
LKYLVNGEEHEFELSDSAEDVQITASDGLLYVRTPQGTRTAALYREGSKLWISYKGQVYEVEPAAAARSKGAVSSGVMNAVMPGVIVEVFATEGEQLQKGDKILVMEAMKTQQAIIAPFDGTVKQLPVKKGEQVSEGQLLAEIEPETE